MLTINGRLFVMEEKNKDKSNITSVAEKELNLLSRHLEVMTTVKERGPIGIIKLSKITGQPQHMIRYSLRTLEKDGIIEPSQHGAIVTDKIHEVLGTIETTLDDFTTKVQELKKKIK
jgi:predicted transcriptional regulator